MICRSRRKNGCATYNRVMIRRSSAFAADAVMCGLINVLQSRHRLNGGSRNEMEQYVAACEGLTIDEYYRNVRHEDLPTLTATRQSVSWRSPITTVFEANNVFHVDLFPSSRGWPAPTVLML